MGALSKIARLVAENPEFRRFFGNSVARDAERLPRVAFHGTPTLDTVESFDPARTGFGHDALGSGFYFTTHPAQASGYAWGQTPTDAPGIVPAFLSIQNPVRVSGRPGEGLGSADVNLTRRQAASIISRAPNIRDLDLSPIANWMDVHSKGGVTDRMINEVAENYTGSTLVPLRNDFFDDPTEYRRVLNKVLGYDGVVAPATDDIDHYVAWFPEQIKSVWNRGTWNKRDPRINYARGGRVKGPLSSFCGCPGAG